MVLCVLILILFAALTRCSAVAPTIISLVASREHRLIMIDESDHPLPSLTLNKPFRVQVYCKIPVDKLSCSKKQNIDELYFNLGFYTDKSNANKNYYFLEEDLVATSTMKGTWTCKLFYSAKDLDDTIDFELNINVLPPAEQNNTETRNNTTQKQFTLSTPPADSTIAFDLRHKAEEIISGSPTTIIIAAVIAVIGMITGIIIGIVFKKKCCQKPSPMRTIEEPQASPKGESDTPIYEELTTVDISKRPPHPLPFSEREENKRYVHYDSPYDHRLARPAIPRKPPQILRRL